MRTILIAAKTEVQMRAFFKNQGLNPPDFRRILERNDICGWGTGTVLLLLPFWYDTVKHHTEILAHVRWRGFKIIEVSEETVLGEAPKPCPNDTNADGDCQKCCKLPGGCTWPYPL